MYPTAWPSHTTFHYFTMRSKQTAPCAQILYWESLRLDVPFDAVEVDALRHRHAALRHRMMEVVRKYNQVTTAVADASWARGLVVVKGPASC